jgi:hypothetical protein
MTDTPLFDAAEEKAVLKAIIGILESLLKCLRAAGLRDQLAAGEVALPKFDPPQHEEPKEP